MDLFVTHDAVFPEVRGDFQEFKRLLGTLSRTDTLFWAARLNLLVSDSTKLDAKDVQGHCIGALFDQKAIARINAFAKEHGRQNVSVFFRGQLLELMRWTCLLSSDQSDDGYTFDRPESRLAFVRVALLASEVWFRRVYKDRMRSDGPIHEVRETILPSIRLSNVENAPSPHPLMGIARGASLFGDRLRKTNPEFDDLFRKAAAPIEWSRSTTSWPAPSTRHSSATTRRSRGGPPRS